MNDSYTWGISGTSFLWSYAILCLLTMGAIYLRRESLSHGRDASVPFGGLDTYELAMLNGGPQLAIMTAATNLHRLGAIVPAASGNTIATAGRPARDDDAGELGLEVYDALERDPGITLRALRRRLESRDPVRRMVSKLTGCGLMLDGARRRHINVLWLSAVPVLALGIARVEAGIRNGRPVGYVAIALVGVAGGALWYAVALARPWATARGRELLDAERGGRRKLDHLPLGAGVPTAVALFGAGALWTVDPSLAFAWDVPREHTSATGSGSGSGWGWGWGWGDSGCGGGGCGGGCGG